MSDEYKNVKFQVLSNDKRDNSNVSSSTDMLISANKIKVENTKNKTTPASGKPKMTITHGVKQKKGNNAKSKVFSKGFSQKIAGKVRTDKKHISKYEVSHEFQEELLIYHDQSYKNCLKSILNNTTYEKTQNKFSEDVGKFEGRSLDDSKTNHLFHNLMNIELLNTILVLISLVSTIFANEFRTSIANEDTDQSLINSLKDAETWSLIVVSASNLLFIVALTFRYLTLIRLLKSVKSMMEHESLFSSSHLWNYIKEVIVTLLHPNVFLKTTYFTTSASWYLIECTYSYNDFLTIISLTRIYILIKCIFMNMGYYNIRSFRVSRLFGGELDIMFAIKCFYNTNPFSFIFFYALIVTTLNSYLLKIVEGPLWYVSSTIRTLSNDFRSYENCVWNTFITMTTVGYGDYFQFCNLGRLISIINAVLGGSLVSLTVLIIQNTFKPDDNETTTLIQYDRLQDRTQINQLFAAQLTTTLNYSKCKKEIKKHADEGDLFEVKKKTKKMKRLIYDRIKLTRDIKTSMQ